LICHYLYKIQLKRLFLILFLSLGLFSFKDSGHIPNLFPKKQTTVANKAYICNHSRTPGVRNRTFSPQPEKKNIDVQPHTPGIPLVPTTQTNGHAEKLF
jgi:hypothetical protein